MSRFRARGLGLFFRVLGLATTGFRAVFFKVLEPAMTRFRALDWDLFFRVLGRGTCKFSFGGQCVSKRRDVCKPCLLCLRMMRTMRNVCKPVFCLYCL